MTKEYILNAFKDINYVYNNPSKYDDLSHMLDELIEDTFERIIKRIEYETEYAYADFYEYKYDILYMEPDEVPDDDFRYGMERAVEIINKYKGKGEENDI